MASSQNDSIKSPSADARIDIAAAVGKTRQKSFEIPAKREPSEDLQSEAGSQADSLRSTLSSRVKEMKTGEVLINMVGNKLDTLTEGCRSRRCQQ